MIIAALIVACAKSGNDNSKEDSVEVIVDKPSVIVLDCDLDLNYNTYQSNKSTTDNRSTMQTIGDTTVDPDFEDDTNGDFRLKSTSGLLNTGMPLRVGVG